MDNTWVYNEFTGWIQWLRPNVDTVRGSIILHNVHSGRDCRYRHCVIHNPMAHDMSNWRLIWRDDRGIFERVCAHGVGHPDPDQFEYWEEIGQTWQSVHGCDGCCIGLTPQ